LGYGQSMTALKAIPTVRDWRSFGINICSGKSGVGGVVRESMPLVKTCCVIYEKGKNHLISLWARTGVKTPKCRGEPPGGERNALPVENDRDRGKKRAEDKLINNVDKSRDTPKSQKK